MKFDRNKLVKDMAEREWQRAINEEFNKDFPDVNSLFLKRKEISNNYRSMYDRNRQH